jgi:uncharacterized repeat protein (TIGR03803 family)
MSRALTVPQCAIAIAFALAVTPFAVQTAQAQTLTVLHNFTGGVDGAFPHSGTLDAAGNFYGATQEGGDSQRNCGNTGCGIVFKLSHGNSGWVESTLYNFTGGSDGWEPTFGPTFGPDGSLYGTTPNGGNQSCREGCGIVYKLQPPATFCRSIVCPWNETILHTFTAGTDGAIPSSGVTFDSADNLYGTTEEGGTASFCTGGCGVVYEMTPSRGNWVESVLYAFAGGTDGEFPLDGVVMNSSGDLFGTSDGPTQNGYPGAVYELAPSGSGWIKSFYYIFHGTNNGAGPIGLIIDRDGNLYGGTETGGPENGGTVYELSPGGSGANFTLLYALPTIVQFGPVGPDAPLTRDAAGNLYGTTGNGGQFGMGSVFKLTAAMGSWTFTSLHDFTGGDDGAYPTGPVLLDSQENVYGTALTGGLYNNGVAFKLVQ